MRAYIEQTGNRARAWLVKLLGKEEGVPSTLLGQYSYTDITHYCDRALSPQYTRDIRTRLLFQGTQRQTETFEQAYRELGQIDSPTPISAAVIIGLGRAGNLQHVPDVDMLKRASYLLRAVSPEQYRKFCTAIDQSIRDTTLMPEGFRPDYASFRQLAVLATLSYRESLTTSRELIRYDRPYKVADGQVVSKKKDFIKSLGGGESGAACVRLAVDLGILTTQPEKLTQEEKEWCRRSMHLYSLMRSASLKGRLERFAGLL